MKKETILFVVAHSDDHVLGGGGTIARYANEGKNVIVTILSYGEKSHPWLKETEAKTMRANESRQAGEALGCKTIFFDLKENHYLEGYKDQKIDEKLRKLINTTKPRKIFTHSDEDPHPDHRATLTIIKEVAISCEDKPELYSFPVWNLFTLRRRDEPRLYVDITNSFGTKLTALGLFRSQLFNAIYPLYLGVLIRAIKNGLHIHTRYAETFHKIQ